MIIFGASNLLGDVYDCCRALGRQVTTIVLNVPEEVRPRTKSLATRLSDLGVTPNLQDIEAFRPSDGEEYFVAISSAKKMDLVRRLTQEHGVLFCSLIHPSAYVSPYASVGAGVFIGAGSIVGPGAIIEDHVFINRKVSVGHDTVVGTYSSLQPGCNIAGHVSLGRGATVGMGANIIHELTVGDGAVVGAGATVIRDVPSASVVVGVPARPMERR